MACYKCGNRFLTRPNTDGDISCPICGRVFYDRPPSKWTSRSEDVRLPSGKDVQTLTGEFDVRVRNLDVAGTAIVRVRMLVYPLTPSHTVNKILWEAQVHEITNWRYAPDNKNAKAFRKRLVAWLVERMGSSVRLRSFDTAIRASASRNANGYERPQDFTPLVLVSDLRFAQAAFRAGYSIAAVCRTLTERKGEKISPGRLRAGLIALDERDNRKRKAG